MAQLGVVGSASTKQATILNRLIEVRSRLRNVHSRLGSANSRAGLLSPLDTQAAQLNVSKCVDLAGVSTDIEGLSEQLTQDCCEIERIV